MIFLLSPSREYITPHTIYLNIYLSQRHVWGWNVEAFLNRIKPDIFSQENNAMKVKHLSQEICKIRHRHFCCCGHTGCCAADVILFSSWLVLIVVSFIQLSYIIQKSNLIIIHIYVDIHFHENNRSTNSYIAWYLYHAFIVQLYSFWNVFLQTLVLATVGWASSTQCANSRYLARLNWCLVQSWIFCWFEPSGLDHFTNFFHQGASNKEEI